ncbi:MAG: hypothetical protein U0930_14545 [Pirellulales bacterium]
MVLLLAVLKSIKLLDEGGVDLALELDGKYTVRAGEQPRIATGSFITGDAKVELIPPKYEKSTSQIRWCGRFASERF